MKYNHTLQDLIESILKLADLNQQNREREDVFRTINTAAEASGRAYTLRFLGVEYDFGTWMDGEYEMVGFFQVEDVVLIKNSVINWKAYADAVVDNDHCWGGKELAIVERR